MIRHSLIFVLLLNMYSSSILAQPGMVDSIHFTGNKRTSTDYLKRFLSVGESDVFDSVKIQEDMRRLRTLSSILDVKANLYKADSVSILDYEINERWTLLPVGDFGISSDNFWVGTGLMESNLFGKGIYLYGYLQYKMPFSVHLILRNPYLFGSKLGYEVQYRISDILESNTNQNVDYYNLNQISLAGKYQVKYEKDVLAGIARRTESVYREDSRIDRKISYRYFVEFRFQKMDYQHFIQDGWQNFLFMNYASPVTNHAKSLSVFNDFRFFKSIQKVNLAARFMGGISNENNYFYLPYAVDSYKNFRGSGYRYIVGNRLLAANVECRYTLFKNNKVGMQFVGFTDIGSISFNSDNTFIAFAGPGARFIFKKVYNAVLSIDYGISISNPHKKGWVMGWGQYF